MPDPENLQGSGPENLGVVDADGNFAEDWAEKYPESDRATLSRFKKFDDLITSHMAVRRKFGKDPDTLVELPGEGATDEVKAEFHRRRGVPETAEEYKFERSKELSERIVGDIDDSKVAAWAQIAKKWNLDQEQFNGAANDWLALMDGDMTAFDLAQQDKKQKDFEIADAALRKEMGKGYEERVARANMVLRKYDGVEMVAKLGLENSPELTRFLDNIAEDMSEDRIKGLTVTTIPTPHQVEAKIAELRARPEYMQEDHPQHKAIVAEISELYKKKAG